MKPYYQDTGDASASQIEKDLGFNRVSVARIFTKSGKFVQTRRVKHQAFYGLVSNMENRTNRQDEMEL